MGKATWVGGPKDGQPATQEDMDAIAEALKAAVLVPDAIRRIQELEAALLAAKIEHRTCDDPFYTCPVREWDDDQALIAKGKEPYLDWPEGATRPDCTCDADAHNAAIDRALKGER